jgi:ferredoxin--NADP+ reductase
MNLSEYDISNPFSAVVAGSERLTPEKSKVEVRHILLELAERDIEFAEGQSVGVLAPVSA